MTSLIIGAKANLFAQNNAERSPLDLYKKCPLLCHIMWQAHAEETETGSV